MSFDGHSLKKHPNVTSLLVELARFRGRRLATGEVDELLPQILRITGVSWANRKTRIEAESSPVGFVPETNLLTPTGDRSIGSLERGDTVFSVDQRTGRFIRNEVERITKLENVIVNKFSLLPASGITAAPGQPFYSIDHGAYVSLEALKDSSRLMKLKTGNSRLAQVTTVERGPLSKSGRRLVCSIQLKLPPFNFCVNSLLVLDQKFDSKFFTRRSRWIPRVGRQPKF